MLVADGAHHGPDGVVVAHVTERDELFTSLAVVRAHHALVGVDRRSGDVGAGQHGDARVVFAQAEVQSGCALEVGVLEGHDGETESGGEGFSQVGDVIEEGVERDELRAGSNGRSDYRLDKGHLDVGVASLSEDILDDVGSGNGVIVEEGAGLHTDGDDERAEGLGLPGVAYVHSTPMESRPS